VIAHISTSKPDYYSVISSGTDSLSFSSGTEFYITILFDQELIPYHYWSCSCSSCWGVCLQKQLKAPSFQIRSGWNLAQLFPSEYTSIDRVRFPIWCHTFKMAAMTSFPQKSAAVWWVHTGMYHAAASTSSWSILYSYLFLLFQINYLKCMPSWSSIEVRYHTTV